MQVSQLKETLKGSLIGILFAAVMLAVFTFALLKLNITKENYIYILFFTCSVSGMVSGYVSARKKREKGILNGLLAWIVPLLIFIAAMSIAYNGFSFFEFIPASFGILFSMIGGIAAVNIKRKKKKLINRRK